MPTTLIDRPDILAGLTSSLLVVPERDVPSSVSASPPPSHSASSSARRQSPKNRRGEPSTGAFRSAAMEIRTIELQGGRIKLELNGREPRWSQVVLQKLQQVVALRSGWNSYGAAPVSARAVLAALEFMYSALENT